MIRLLVALMLVSACEAEPLACLVRDADNAVVKSYQPAPNADVSTNATVTGHTWFLLDDSRINPANHPDLAAEREGVPFLRRLGAFIAYRTLLAINQERVAMRRRLWRRILSETRARRDAAAAQLAAEPDDPDAQAEHAAAQAAYDRAYQEAHQ